MSELKWNWAYLPYLDPPEGQKESALKAGYIKVVDKYEADKVIADLEESHKVEVKKILILNRKQSNRANRLRDNMEQVIRHQKYKRCLAMALLALEKRESYKAEYEEWCLKWYKRWLELAEKFKDKETE